MFRKIKHSDRLIVFAVFLFLSGSVFSQTKITLSGYVSDASTGELLAGATVFAAEPEKGTISNSYGFFSLVVKPEILTLMVRFVGYENRKLVFQFAKDTLLHITLEAKNTLGEIEVKATTREGFLTLPSMSTHRMDAKEISRIPAMLGEPDLLKAIQLLPGVSFATEGSTAMSVRGGSPDQTLIQLDGVPVYNVNHLWGFMSLFNNDAIKDVTLYKGGLPARFGGRLSSVLDIAMKEGNMKKRGGTFSISPIAGHYTLEGPIVKDKISYMVSGRKTWIDALLWTAMKLEKSGKIETPTYGFWDINAKTNWIVNAKNRLFLSFYTGKDAFIFESDDNNSEYLKFSYNWQNVTSVLRWNMVFSPRFFANFSLYNSRFTQKYINLFDKKGKDYYKGINILNDISAKGDFDWSATNGARVKFGYLLSSQKFSPEVISFKDDTISYKINKDVYTKNFISELYFEGEFSLSGNLKANAGLRAGNLATSGKNYASLQPRLSLSWMLSDNLSAKASYNRMKQHLHQLQNTTLGIPTELWVSSTKNIKPGTSDLISAGLFFQPQKSKYNFSVEVYYSSLRDVLMYKPGTLSLKERGESWEDYISTGNGESYGLELMAEKREGRLTGWLSYTLSKSTRRLAEINFGETFPYNFDRRHQANLFAAYSFNEKIKRLKTIRRQVSGNFKFASGNYITLAEQEYQGISLPLMEGSTFSEGWYKSRSLINVINNYQMPAFHHLNLAYSSERISPDKSIVWSFSVYNVYNRHNPWFYFKKGTQLKQITLFPVIPSVSFTYKW